MKGDIALAGFVLTAEEWEAIDPVAQAELLAGEPPVVEPIAPPRPPRGSIPAMPAVDVDEPWARAEQVWRLAQGSGAYTVAGDPTTEPPEPERDS
ncbi:MAG: hypothetical protein AB7O24_05275 [Kofleriaceae bacterium]